MNKNYHTPWSSRYSKIIQKCTNKRDPKYPRYGGRGIKCLISSEEIKELWFRDKAYLMKKPSIDREDNDGNYTFDNCRFIEHALNSGKDKSQSVRQFDLQGNFIKEWSSGQIAANTLGLLKSHICSVLKGNRRSTGGFVWRYKI